MKKKFELKILGLGYKRVILALSVLLPFSYSLYAEPLKVCVTTPDVESLVKSVGGEQVEVLCFTKGAQDPHVVDIRPSFVSTLNQTDVLIQVGLGIENAYLAEMMERVKRSELRPGGTANLNLGINTLPLEGESGKGIQDSFHEEGNPHYLLDPVEGLRCSKEICDKLISMRPESETIFEKNHRDFAKAWMEMFYGEAVAAKLKVQDFAEFVDRESLEQTVQQALIKYADELKGVSGIMKPLKGIQFVSDHDEWPWFARRFDLQILDQLEVTPGVPPSTQHLTQLVAKMKQQDVSLILSAPYFPIRYAKLVQRVNNNATIVPMSHQTRARPGSEDYLKMIENNCKSMARAKN